MDWQLFTAIVLGAIILSLFVSKERDPMSIVLGGAGVAVFGCIVVLIIKAVWLLIKAPW